MSSRVDALERLHVRDERAHERGPSDRRRPRARSASVSTIRSRMRVAQLGGRGVGERDDENVAHRRARARAGAAGTARRCSTSCRCPPTLRSASSPRARTRRGRAARRVCRGRTEPPRSGAARCLIPRERALRGSAAALIGGTRGSSRTSPSRTPPKTVRAVSSNASSSGSCDAAEREPIRRIGALRDADCGVPLHALAQPRDALPARVAPTTSSEEVQRHGEPVAYSAHSACKPRARHRRTSGRRRRRRRANARRSRGRRLAAAARSARDGRSIPSR